jgi:hypothetical protein
VVIWSSAKAFTQVRILYSPLDIVGRLGNPFGLISQISRFDSWSRNLIWCLWCKGSTTDCGSVRMGSNPINHPKGELPEWLKEQFAKLSSSNWCIGSNPILSANRFGYIRYILYICIIYARFV